MIARLLLPLCAGFCFSSFVWGMVRHFRRLGKRSRTMLWTALLAACSAVLQITALCRLAKPSVGSLLPALALYGVSAILFWRAVGVTRGKLAACGQGALTREVITAGPYRFIRHPFYTSYNLTWIAGFAATGWWPIALSALVMAILYDRQSHAEEALFAASPLAREYGEYQRRTGRYFPRFDRLISTGSGQSHRSGARIRGVRADDETSDRPRTIR
jgi:protein-S-isoprenylcysteine O-methyltransferase Ste14